jgi:uncharacterized protein YpuA (DUF1002 family)
MTRTTIKPPRRWTTLAAFLSIACVAAVIALALAPLGRAAEEGRTITLGESLNDFERTELLTLFGAQPDDRILTITIADTLDAMAGIAMVGAINSAYSSTALTCRDLGEGLDVSTVNITVVTPDLFAIALVTAGIGDATLVVAAPGAKQAQGMTALAGIFKTWDLAPCASGNTNPERQKLALEEIAIASTIGGSVIAVGIADGMQRASNIVLETQKTIVTEGLTNAGEIDAAIAAQEVNQGVYIPLELRPQLVDLMTRLAGQEIDWSTFAEGWTIERDAFNTRITMRGDGIAIRNAQASATAKAERQQTRAAERAANKTATANAESNNATATAQAALDMTATAEADATWQAEADLTATAEAIPTATPDPYSSSGKIVAVTESEIVVEQPAGSGVSSPYRLAAEVTVMRGGEPAEVADLREGDQVELTLHGGTGEVLRVAAEPVASSSLAIWRVLAGFLAVGGLLSTVVVARRQRVEPFIVTFARPIAPPERSDQVTSVE